MEPIITITYNVNFFLWVLCYWVYRRDYNELKYTLDRIDIKL